MSRTYRRSDRRAEDLVNDFGHPADWRFCPRVKVRHRQRSNTDRKIERSMAAMAAQVLTFGFSNA